MGADEAESRDDRGRRARSVSAVLATAARDRAHAAPPNQLGVGLMTVDANDPAWAYTEYAKTDPRGSE